MDRGSRSPRVRLDSADVVAPDEAESSPLPTASNSPARSPVAESKSGPQDAPVAPAPDRLAPRSSSRAPASRRLSAVRTASRRLAKGALRPVKSAVDSIYAVIPFGAAAERRAAAPAEADRAVQANDPTANRALAYADNIVKTSRYTWCVFSRPTGRKATCDVASFVFLRVARRWRLVFLALTV